ncbi:MAG TPA: hypothetical protein VFK56_02970, partial [Mycobacterium sp.]|nr:hypothetical protein [Mycobacterium sp.]
MGARRNKAAGQTTSDAMKGRGLRPRAASGGCWWRYSAEVHAVLAKCGIQVLMSDLFGVEGTALLGRLRLPAPYAARIASLRRLLDDLEFEIDLFDNLVGLAVAAQRDQLGPVAHQFTQLPGRRRRDPRLGKPAHPEQIRQIG